MCSMRMWLPLCVQNIVRATVAPPAQSCRSGCDMTAGTPARARTPAERIDIFMEDSYGGVLLYVCGC